MNILDALKNTVYGQDDALSAISKTVKRYEAGLHRNIRPIGAFIFSGPSGSGKSFTVQELAKVMNYKLIRIDCSEYGQEHEVARILGAPAGYVNSNEIPFLTKAIEGTDGKFILLLDECEKAHHKLYDIFLQVLDHGELTDSGGRVIKFNNSIVIFTTNIGSKGYSLSKEIGLVQRSPIDNVERDTNKAIRDYFRIEFINRLDGIVMFHPLGKESYNKIVNDLISEINSLLEFRAIQISISDVLREYLVSSGLSNEFGARELKRVFVSKVEDYIADKISGHEMEDGYKYLIFIKDDEIYHRKIGSYSLIDTIMKKSNRSSNSNKSNTVSK